MGENQFDAPLRFFTDLRLSITQIQEVGRARGPKGVGVAQEHRRTRQSESLRRTLEHLLLGAFHVDLQQVRPEPALANDFVHRNRRDVFASARQRPVLRIRESAGRAIGSLPRTV